MHIRILLFWYARSLSRLRNNGKAKAKIIPRTISSDSKDSCLSDSNDEDYKPPRAIIKGQNVEVFSDSEKELEVNYMMKIKQRSQLLPRQVINQGVPKYFY